MFIYTTKFKNASSPSRALRCRDWALFGTKPSCYVPLPNVLISPSLILCKNTSDSGPKVYASKLSAASPTRVYVSKIGMKIK